MRISPVFTLIIACIAISSVLIATVVLIHEITGTPVAALVRDPTATMETPAYLGLLSNTTILIWAAAAAISLFAAILLPGGHPVRGVLTLAGSITLILTFDDIYIFHEVIAPELLGIPEKVVYLGYALAAIWLLVRGRHLAKHSAQPLLILALAGLGLSVGIDVLDSRGCFPVEDPYLLEDGFKVTGALFWLAYFAMLAGTSLRES